MLRFTGFTGETATCLSTGHGRSFPGDRLQRTARGAVINQRRAGHSKAIDHSAAAVLVRPANGGHVAQAASGSRGCRCGLNGARVGCRGLRCLALRGIGPEAVPYASKGRLRRCLPSCASVARRGRPVLHSSGPSAFPWVHPYACLLALEEEVSDDAFLGHRLVPD